MCIRDRIKEATEKRGLLNYRTTADCMPHLMDKKNVDMLTSHKVFTERELESRMEIMLDNYCKTVIIAVSYTHLDVYKRQALSYGFLVGSPVSLNVKR